VTERKDGQAGACKETKHKGFFYHIARTIKFVEAKSSLERAEWAEEMPRTGAVIRVNWSGGKRQPDELSKTSRVCMVPFGRKG